MVKQYISTSSWVWQQNLPKGNITSIDYSFAIIKLQNQNKTKGWMSLPAV